MTPVSATARSRGRVRWGLGTVTTYLQRVAAAGLSWPLLLDFDDAAQEARVFARPAVPPAR